MLPRKRENPLAGRIGGEESIFKSGTWSHRMPKWAILVNPWDYAMRHVKMACTALADIKWVVDM